MQDTKLMEYFKFDEADLQANRAGQFSAAQKRRLGGRQSEAIREKKLAVAIGLPLALLMLCGMALLIYKDASSGTGEDAAYIIWLGLCGLPLFVAVLYIWRLSRIHQGYALKTAQGPVNLLKTSRLVDNVTYTAYELHIGGQRFNVEAALGDVIMQGDTYAVYYSQGTVSGAVEVLSAELVGEEASKK